MPVNEKIPLSVLDLSFVREGETAREALLDSLELARAAENFGYRRFWMAEHHNMEGIASAATSVAIGFVAAGTHTIRVGSGGIMLPNHSPLVIAEQFGTLASLYPQRIDLGVGRAPGTDYRTARALRRNLDAADTFPQDVQELKSYFEPTAPGQIVCATPGQGLKVPVWLLGSSLYSARLAAFLGLPFAFASHFAPEHLMDALQLYRSEFQPSEDLAKPYAMVAVNVVASDTDEDAEFLFSTAQLGVLNLLRGQRGKMQRPITNLDSLWSQEEREGVKRFMRYSYVGTVQKVREGLDELVAQTQADEIITVSRIFDLGARVRSLQLLAEARTELATAV